MSGDNMPENVTELIEGIEVGPDTVTIAKTLAPDVNLDLLAQAQGFLIGRDQLDSSVTTAESGVKTAKDARDEKVKGFIRNAFQLLMPRLKADTLGALFWMPVTSYSDDPRMGKMARWQFDMDWAEGIVAAVAAGDPDWKEPERFPRAWVLAERSVLRNSKLHAYSTKNMALYTQYELRERVPVLVKAEGRWYVIFEMENAERAGSTQYLGCFPDKGQAKVTAMQVYESGARLNIFLDNAGFFLPLRSRWELRADMLNGDD